MKFKDPQWTLHKPRSWQSAAMTKIADHYADPQSKPAIVRAIMGAGKALLIAEVCACADTMGPIVVTTSSQLLVRQLHRTIADRIGGGKTVGRYYTEAKQPKADVIVSCIPSVPALAAQLHKQGRRPALWIADEAHRCECSTLINIETFVFNPEAALGFTATPFRASHDESISMFDNLLYDYGPDAALRDGVVVPWRIEHWNEEGTPLDEACVQMIRQAKGPGIVNASTVADCEEFCKTLKAAGIKASTIHSRIKDDEVQDRIQFLKAGALHCLVHVNMLVEGADYPWLRWMCLRRNVDSRVRFLQEIGRALRASPGKTEAVFYDPNDLFGLHRISYEAALGCMPDPDDVVEEILELPPEKIADAIAKEPEAIGLQVFEMELRKLVVACDAAGMCPHRSITKRDERIKQSVGLQAAGVRKFAPEAKPYIPANWQPFIGMACDRIKQINFGSAQDLICLLISVASAKRFPPLGVAFGATSTPEAPAAPTILPALVDKDGQLLFRFESA